MQCGLFTTDDSEHPEKKKNKDPFDFQMIMLGNVQKFNFNDYDDLFHKDFGYIDLKANVNLIHPRLKLLTRLNKISLEYFIENKADTLMVIWSRTDPDNTDNIESEQGQYELESRNYSVLAVTVDSLQFDTTVYTGKSIVTVDIDSSNKVTIVNWKDTPDAGDKSFFNPDFITQ